MRRNELAHHLPTLASPSGTREAQPVRPGARSAGFHPGAISSVLEQHQTWLSGFGRKGHLKKWEELFRDQPESASVEACVAAFLRAESTQVEPVDARGTGGTDFRCRSRGSELYVEAKCKTMRAVDNFVGFPAVTPEMRTGVSSYFMDSPVEYGAALADAASGQAMRREGPVLAVLGTFSFHLDTLDLELACRAALAGEIHPEYPYGPEAPPYRNYPADDSPLKGMAFTNYDAIDGKFWPIRTHVSGILQIRFFQRALDGTRVSWDTRGALHPSPKYPLPPGSLSNVRFLELRDGWRDGVFVIVDSDRTKMEEGR